MTSFNNYDLYNAPTKFQNNFPEQSTYPNYSNFTNYSNNSNFKSPEPHIQPSFNPTYQDNFQLSEPIYTSPSFNNKTDFLRTLEKELPSVFTRQEAAKHLGGLISAKTMSNSDTLGTGVKNKLRIGNKVAYTKVDFMEWLRSRLK